ncbi:V-type proton ATPase subunit e 2 [Folsomia candida]|uniref:V-type proton ATPase subunit e 2 n=1 Tax=Folsomia candida TaxID=158441 RepID=UPI000B90977C|nr:V-type proton ATPase subunit e 2 [Folsomia candida]
MGATALPILFFTILWGVVGIVLPFFVPKGPNRGVVQVVLMLTGACCWLFWLCCYMCQMNPLIGPIIKRDVALVMQQEWGTGPIVTPGA